MFFLGITIIFLLGLAIFSATVFFSKPAPSSVGQVFVKPKINLNFAVLDSPLVKNSVPMTKMQKEFYYIAQTNKKVKKSGSIFADSIEDAKKIIEDAGLIVLNLEEAKIGRENPFLPFYTPTPVTINTTK